ncbi:MAG: GDYXXLXY domain-containing protein [Gammaproteobacteria bacterium]|jgi:uncharacterized membrane-anchored protein|nr:GDYXXLXY domain-containing protein [Gammaproteobacteria bacterium]MBQ0773977.1 GDYXXLXY domain-containing protein [Gammaproteobacteria bacterium]
MNNVTQSSRFVMIGLCTAVVFQLVVLAGELIVAVYPRWTGTPIRVLVEPVDPRDLFRGNYARLGYSFNRVPESLWNGSEALRPGQVVYVVLSPIEKGAEDDEGGADWIAASITLQPPRSELTGTGQTRELRFIRGRVSSHRHALMQTLEGDEGPAIQAVDRLGSYEIEYGIEAWFAPKMKAQALERDLRRGAWATLYIAESGRAALVDLETEFMVSDLMDDGADE